jgi:nitroimidazol reductase NimA-like FMN-containing flavoprotein (pyridoxamine 5'-phosphate oxidase superfamily)
MPEPIGDRPSMHEGYLGVAPLPWSWAEDQLADARNYWVSTISSNGRPHVRPVWGVWLDDTVQFSTGGRHVDNIARDPRVTVNLESGDECVIVEGLAEATTDEARRRAFIDVYEPKYDWPMTLDFVDVLFVVRPNVVFGWIAHDIAPQATLFGATATRWRFS